MDISLADSPFFPTVFDAIRSSGGITQFSDLTSIRVIRKNNLSDGGGKMKFDSGFAGELGIGYDFGPVRTQFIYNSKITHCTQLKSGFLYYKQH